MPGMPIPGMPLVPMGLPGHGPGGRSAAGMPFFERPFPIVRLRGLPFNAGELDIFEFFQASAAGEGFERATAQSSLIGLCVAAQHAAAAARPAPAAPPRVTPLCS